MLEIALMPHQQDFCQDHTTPFLGLIGGFGCGKTKAFCYKTVIMAGLNVGFEGAIAEPTNFLTRTHLIPNMISVLEELKIPYKFEKSLGIFTLEFKEGSCKIYTLSGENYMRLVGYNLAFFGSDETDTSGHEIAQEMWNKAISRVRWGRHTQIYTTSTPEGHKFLHYFFKENASDDRRVIHATSYDNPFIPASYIESMKKNYTEAQWKVWALGQWGNLYSSLVYNSYDRELNNSNELISIGDTLHIGLDFNIDHMAAVTHIIKNNNPIAVDELVEIKDVPTMIAIIKKKYSNNPVIIYPDASGKNRNAAGADTSMALLRQAGFRIVVNAANPAVGDRINAMNAMFNNANGERRYKVNSKMCPTYSRSLERQSWVKKPTGAEPDKSNNIDHPLDGAGYFIQKMYPLQGRPTMRTM